MKEQENKFLNKLPKNGIVAEIGVAEGKHAVAMKEISTPEKMYLIDPWIVCFKRVKVR